MVEVSVVIGMNPKFEYFCNACKQLRLSFVELAKCGNCGSTNIIKGAIGTLDKESLKRGKP